jgi:hypothetical protein
MAALGEVRHIDERLDGWLISEFAICAVLLEAFRRRFSGWLLNPDRKNVKVPSTETIHLYQRWETRIIELAKQLGLSPTSRQRLGVSSGATPSLAEVFIDDNEN